MATSAKQAVHPWPLKLLKAVGRTTLKDLSIPVHVEHHASKDVPVGKHVPSRKDVPAASAFVSLDGQRAIKIHARKL